MPMVARPPGPPPDRGVAVRRRIDGRQLRSRPSSHRAVRSLPPQRQRPTGRWRWTRSGCAVACATRRRPAGALGRCVVRPGGRADPLPPRAVAQPAQPDRVVRARGVPDPRPRPARGLDRSARSAPPTRSAGWSSAAAPALPAWPTCSPQTRPDREPDRSARLVVHPLDRLGGVLGRVDRVLERVVEVAPLDDLERVAAIAEQPGDGRPRQAVRLVLEVVDRAEVRLEALEPVELAKRRGQLDGLLGEDRGQPPGLRRSAGRRRR